jgi:hypothetical protein
MKSKCAFLKKSRLKPRQMSQLLNPWFAKAITGFTDGAVLLLVGLPCTWVVVFICTQLLLSRGTSLRSLVVITTRVPRERRKTHQVLIKTHPCTWQSRQDVLVFILTKMLL